MPDMNVNELTLASIDGHRHLAISQDLVTAVAFAARSGYDDTFCYRFVSALVMTDQLHDSTRGGWLDVLKHIRRLEAQEEEQS